MIVLIDFSILGLLILFLMYNLLLSSYFEANLIIPQKIIIKMNEEVTIQMCVECADKYEVIIKICKRLNNL